MKKVVSTVILILVLMLGMQSFAQVQSRVSFSIAEETLLQNNTQLSILYKADNRALQQYNDAVERVKKMDVLLMDINAGIYTRINDEKQKYLVPKQMKYSELLALNNYLTTKNNLIIGLRYKYLDLLVANNNLKSKQLELQLNETANSQSKAKYALGMISDIDMEESEYKLDEAMKNLEAAQRNKENATRSLNAYIGVTADVVYDDVRYNEKYDVRLKPVTFYIDRALKERFDLVKLQSELELKEIESGIIEKYLSYKEWTDVKPAYEGVTNDIKSLKLQIEKTTYEIEIEVKNSYIDIQNEKYNVSNSMNNLNLQKNKLKKLQAQFDQGMLVKAVVDRQKALVDSLGNVYKTAVYNYNTKLMKFENSTGFGPAY